MARGERSAVPRPFGARRAVRCWVEKWRHAVQAGRAFHHRPERFLVFRREGENGVGAGDGAQRRFQAGAIGSAGLLARVRRLGGDIGNVERRADRRAEPIGRLVVNMVGEPELGAGRAVRRLPFGDQRRGDFLAAAGPRLLRRAIAGPVIGAKFGGQRDLMAACFERPRAWSTITAAPT